MKLLRSRLSDDLNASIAQLVEFSREGILVYPNLKDRRFGRKLASAEPVDEYLSAVGTCRRPGQCRSLVCKLVRIVGKCVKIFAFEHHGARVATRFNADRGIFV